MRTLRTLAILAPVLFALSACAMAPLPPPQASIDGIQAVRATGMAPANVGSFTAAPGHAADMDRSITVRAGVQAAPDGSFAHYLGDLVAADLKAAGLFDAGSDLVVSGVITDAHLDSSIGAARGKLEVRFTASKAGKAVFDKTLSADAVWDSSFVGAVAIPDAINHYVGLFPAVAAKLFADPDFIAAVRRK